MAIYLLKFGEISMKVCNTSELSLCMVKSKYTHGYNHVIHE